MEHDKLFIYKRHYNEETWLIIANFSKESCEIPADINLEGEVITSPSKLISAGISHDSLEKLAIINHVSSL